MPFVRYNLIPPLVPTSMTQGKNRPGVLRCPFVAPLVVRF